MTKLYEGPRQDLLRTGTAFRVKRHGEDPRFVLTSLRVPANLLRDRAADVLPTREMAKRHRAYRARVVIGPSYRADTWAALDENPDLTASELARREYGSFATAWHVRSEHGAIR